MDKPTVATIVASPATTDAIMALVERGTSLNLQLAAVTASMANEVLPLGISASASFNLLTDVYGESLKHLKPLKDVMARFNALLHCKLAGQMPVEIAPPSKDGKISAVFKAADTLTATEAKRLVSDVRASVREAEETPDERQVRVKKEAAAKAVAQAIANKLAAEESAKKREVAFAFVLAQVNRAELLERLAADPAPTAEAGYRPISKNEVAPVKGGRK